MKHIFREYDIRGIFGKDYTPAFAKALGFVLASVMQKKGAKNVSVGHDARLSANALTNALIFGLQKGGMQVFSLGLVPTPLGYFSNFACGIDANIMVTASHNPAEYNGFKITINKESFFADELSSIYNEVAKNLNQFDDKIEDIKCEKIDIIKQYLDFLEKEFSHLKGKNLSVAIDSAGGAACEVAAKILDVLGIKYAHYFYEFDGTFAAHEPDPTIEKNLFALKNELKFADSLDTLDLQKKYTNGYTANSAKIAFAFDGDADRVVCLLKDKIIKGDELCYIFAKNIKEPKILCEVKCSKVIFDKINQIGTCKMCKTGHSNIKKAIKENNSHLAAELSGHVFFNDRYFGYDDAIYAMLRIIELYAQNENFADVLNELDKSFSSDEIKISVDESKKFDIIKQFKEEIIKQNIDADLIDIDGVRLNYKDGFLLLRASNTSPYLVSRFEAKSEERLKELQEICTKILGEIIDKIN